jgi:outer membrane protein OmpU
MKRFPLGPMAALGVGAMTGTLAQAASAADGIKLEVGGFYRAAYMVVLDDDDFPEPGFDRNMHGFFSNAEVHFTGSTVLDNGLEVGARVELEGETDEDQIDEAWIWFSGVFGEVRVGSDDDALANTCIAPPGGTANFSAFSPDQWGANVVGVGSFFNPRLNSNTVCTGVDDFSDAQKIIYITPAFYGFQLTASYTPEPRAETHNDGAGPHVGMPGEMGLFASDDAAVYLTYTYEGRGWGLIWGGGASFESGIDNTEDAISSFDVEEQDFYQTGLVLTFGNFSIGAAFEYFNDLINFQTTALGTVVEFEQDVWVAGGGIAYRYDAWTFGAQYSYREDTLDIFVATGFPTVDSEIKRQQQRLVATVNYALGPGINLDAEIGYTWVDFDPEQPISTVTDENYDAVEFGIGTAITF